MAKKVLWESGPSKRFALYYGLLHADVNKRWGIKSKAPLLGLLVAIVFTVIYAVFFDYSILGASGGWAFAIVMTLPVWGFWLVLVAMYVYACLLAKTLRYTIRPDSISVEGGITSKYHVDVPVKQITGVSITQNFFERLLGIENIVFDIKYRGGLGYKVGFYALDDANKPFEILNKMVGRSK